MAAIPVADSQEGCAFVFLPSFLRFRDGEGQEDGLSVQEARKNASSPATSLWKLGSVPVPSRKKKVHFQ